MQFDVGKHGLGLDHVEQPGATRRIAGRLELSAIARERQQRVACAHPLLMVHVMVGKAGFEIGEQRPAHVLLLSHRRGGVRGTGGDHRVLPPFGKKGQADGDAGRDHVAVAVGPALVGDIETPVGTLVGPGDGDVCLGLGDTGTGGAEIGMRC